MFALKDYDFIFPALFIASILISSYFFLTTGNNPGFYNNVFRASNPDMSVVSLNNENTQSHEIFINSNERKNEENIEMQKSKDETNNTTAPVDNKNSEDDPFKFCDICKIEKFLRMKHCDKCERCVHKFDHHCFWIGFFLIYFFSIIFNKGACVGEFNHGKFWLFLFFQTITCFLAFIIVKST
jgi:hypothetical protein